MIDKRTNRARLNTAFAGKIMVEGEAPRQLRMKDRYQDIWRFGGCDKIIYSTFAGAKSV